MIRTVRALALLVLLLVPARAASQVLVASWPINSDNPQNLGQAQPGRVALTENDFREGRVYTDAGVQINLAGPLDPGSRMIESTDGSRYVACSFCPYLWKVGGSLLSMPAGSRVEHLVPLDAGRVMIGLRLSSGAVEFQTYDASLTLVGSFNGLAGTAAGALWMTRRPDGSIVACSYVPISGRHLTAYTPDGSTLWDRLIADAGPVASDGEGNLYVRVSATEIRVYDASGNFRHSWFGPAGQPLANVIDIASSRDGTKLFTLNGTINGPVNVYSQLPTPVRATSWGRIKTIYRD